MARTQKNCTKKDLHDSGNQNGVITYLESDILECEVKWTLGSIIRNKASGGDGIPVELFQILKDDDMKCCTQYASKLENSAVATGLEKVSFHSNVKECSNCHTIALISHASKIMLKNLQDRIQQYVNCELPDVQVDLEKAEVPEIKLPTSVGSLKNQES